MLDAWPFASVSYAFNPQTQHFTGVGGGFDHPNWLDVQVLADHEGAFKTGTLTMRAPDNSLLLLGHLDAPIITESTELWWLQFPVDIVAEHLPGDLDPHASLWAYLCKPSGGECSDGPNTAAEVFTVGYADARMSLNSYLWTEVTPVPWPDGLLVLGCILSMVGLWWRGAK